MRRSSVGFLGFAMLALFAGACEQTSTTPSAITNAEGMPADNIVFGVHHVMTRDGVRSSVMDGDSAYVYEGRETMDVLGVKLSFYDANGLVTGNLTSDRGEYNLGGGSFVARGNVVLITNDENGTRKIETEELFYDVNGDQLWSDKPVVITQGERVTRGGSFRSSGAGGNWSMTNAQTEGGLPTEEEGFSF